MSELKSSPAELGPGIGDILKWEASHMTRVAVAALAGTKAGALVGFPLRNHEPLVALTDEADGTVVVQPHNCVIDLSLVSAAAIDRALGGTAEAPQTVHDLAVAGDNYGIVYQSTPINDYVPSVPGE